MISGTTVGNVKYKLQDIYQIRHDVYKLNVLLTLHCNISV
jgi:hypothetical protein